MRDNSEELVLRMEAAAKESKNALGKIKAEQRKQRTDDALKGLGKIFPRGIKHPDKLVKNPGAVVPGLGRASVLFPGYKTIGSSVRPLAKSTGGVLSTTIVTASRQSSKSTNTKVRYKLL